MRMMPKATPPMIIRIGVDAFIAGLLLSSLEKGLLMLRARRRS
jgi:hypothetical protein